MAEFGEDIEQLVSKNQPPAGGDNPQPPAGGDNPQPPAGGDNPQPPAGGDNPQPPANSIDLKAILGEEWGSDVEKAKTLPTMLKELQEKANQTVLPTYADEETASYDQFVRATKIKDHGLFTKIKGFDNTTTDPIDVLVMKKIIDNPKLIGFEAKIKDDLIKQYGVDERLEDEDTLKYNRIKLEEDATTANQAISSLKENISKFDPKAQQEENSKTVAKLQESWAPTLQGIDQSFNKVKSDIVIGEGDKAQTISIETDIPAEMKPQILAEAREFISAFNVPNTEQGQQAVREFMESRALLINRKAVHASIWGQAVAATTKALNMQIHNPALRGNESAPLGGNNPTGNPHVDTSRAAFSE